MVTNHRVLVRVKDNWSILDVIQEYTLAGDHAYPGGNLSQPVHLSPCFREVGGHENLEETCMDTGRTRRCNNNAMGLFANFDLWLKSQHEGMHQ